MYCFNNIGGRFRQQSISGNIKENTSPMHAKKWQRPEFMRVKGRKEKK